MDRSNHEVSDRAKGGSDFLALDVAGAPPGARAAWLADRLRDAVDDGRLSFGARLPASRVLAGELGVSRGVVTDAYQRLVDDGLVEGRGRGGTVVVASPAPSGRSDGGGAASRSGGGSSSGLVAGEASAPAALFAGIERLAVFDALRAAPARIDLTPGVPDLSTFPRAAWLRAERAVLSDTPSAALGYGDPRGASALRTAVAEWLGRHRGIRTDTDAVIVVAGVAQALAILARVLLARGADEIGVEDPGSLGARRQLEEWGLATTPIAVDDGGVDVADLERAGVAALLATPAHQFPTGVVLSGPRRRALTAWLEAGGLLVEDDYDAEHRYDRAPVPAVQSMAPQRVCYAGSISKTLAPALRLGWLVVPDHLHEEVVAGKRAADLGNAVLPQLVLARLMTDGGLERHLRAVRRRHRQRRDAVVAALARHLPSATVHGAAAGLHLTVTFPDEVDDAAVAAAALERGVKVQPLSWHRLRTGPPGVVVGYAARTPSELEEGVRLLATAVPRDRSQP